MKKNSCIFLIILSIFILSQSTYANKQKTGEENFFTVTIDQPKNGSISLEPAIPANGKVTAGTIITVKTAPDKGFAFDGGYFATPGRWGKMFYESMTPTFQVTIDEDKSIGASFIEEKRLQGFTVRQDIVYAQPGVKKLKYDVFSPEGAKNLPCIVIIHGGGWSTNTEDIMRGLARELVKDGDYVVFSIDYRWLNNLDGDETPNQMYQLIEDVYGAIAHIQEHASEYGGDPSRIAVTGDSAGGHLSASAITMTEKIGDGGFGEKDGIYEYLPTYLPKGKTVIQVRDEITKAIKVAAPSYGVFSGYSIMNFLGEQPDDAIKAISPISNIPNIKERAVPQYLLRGTEDNLIKDEMVKAYADALTTAGQQVKYVQVSGIGHAFFDWKPDSKTKATFEEYGVPYAAEMKAFFDEVFNP